MDVVILILNNTMKTDFSIDFNELCNKNVTLHALLTLPANNFKNIFHFSYCNEL